MNSNDNYFDSSILPGYEQIIQCMHCGMCLPDCPTYALTGMERHSPRGRIRMIRAVAEGRLDITANYIESINFCLDCQACVTACPAGVQYGHLVEAARFHIDDQLQARGKKSLLRTFILKTVFKNRAWLRFFGKILRLVQLLRLDRLVQISGILKLFPGQLHKIAAIAPPVPKRVSVAGEIIPQKPERKIRVGVMTGCVQDVFFSDVNRDTAEVLKINGYEVIVPKKQECCGSVHGHNGDRATAQELAKAMIDTFEAARVDFVAVNAAGCGSFMKQYNDLLADDPEYADRAQQFTAKVKDISELLVTSGWDPPKLQHPLKITYHEPCHLVHAQKISAQPRQLLQAIPGIEFRELPEATWCCGSAGIYNVTHYDASMQLLQRKMENIEKTGAEFVVTGNPGCIIQLKYGTKMLPGNIQIIHPVSLLKLCYQQEGVI